MIINLFGLPIYKLDSLTEEFKDKFLINLSGLTPDKIRDEVIRKNNNIGWTVPIDWILEDIFNNLEKEKLGKLKPLEFYTVKGSKEKVQTKNTNNEGKQLSLF